MRIVCLTENLACGGAERQFTELAVLLDQLGHDVRVVLYHAADHYLPRLEENQIPVRVVTYRGRLHRIVRLRKAIRSIKPNVVIVFKRNPALWVELSSLLGRDYRLIVSERNYAHRGMSIGTWARMLSHALADVVVSNSKSQYEFIRTQVSWLRSRTVWIANTIDLQRFCPAKTTRPQVKHLLRILVLGRFSEQKNPLRFLEAVDICRRRHPNVEVTVDWYGSNFYAQGSPARLSRTYLDVTANIRRLGLHETVRTHDPVSDVVPLLHQCDVLCLPSIYEGYSNVIAEAIACGVPVLASNVSDNSLMVHDGVNGFLFDPEDARDIANAIVRFSECTPEERAAMGARSREMAENLISPSLFAQRYENLFLAKEVMACERTVVETEQNAQ